MEWKRLLKGIPEGKIRVIVYDQVQEKFFKLDDYASIADARRVTDIRQLQELTSNPSGEMQIVYYFYDSHKKLVDPRN